MTGRRGESDIPTEGECYFCTELCYDIDFCDGCQEFICDECVGGADSSYRHDVEEHSDGYDD